MTMAVTAEELQYSANGDPELKAAPRTKVFKAQSLFPEATIDAPDEGGDVVEDLSECWQSSGEEDRKKWAVIHNFLSYTRD